MKIFGLEIVRSKEVEEPIQQEIVHQEEPKANYQTGTWNTLYVQSYNGEKNLGEMGALTKYLIDYEALRMRSWKSYLDSEVTQTVLNKFVMWTIGKGLRLQCEPVAEVLKMENINLDKERFNDEVEARFRVVSRSKMLDYSGQKSLNKIAVEAFKNAKIGGDILVVLRVVKGNLKVQLIDGSHLLTSSVMIDTVKEGNTFCNGIEMDSTGKHVAYHVRDTKDLFKSNRIPAEINGLKMAFLVYGLRYRLDNHRGLPVISAVLETISKLERYKEAAVGAAEEVNKIAFQVVHQAYSDGQNPMAKQLARAFDSSSTGENLPADAAGIQLAKTVAVTTNKQAFNNPVGAEIKPMNGGNQTLHFKEFYGTNVNAATAATGIPPEVALSKYDSNFSASRAALKDWEHTLIVERDFFTEDFYQPIYNAWLHIEILKNKINAPGYLLAFKENNEIVIESYRTCRFAGAPVPHIDPLKEVEAERMKLGKSAENIPLTTVEAATEALNSGDSDSNMEQFADEYKNAVSLGIKVVPDPVIVQNQN